MQNLENLGFFEILITQKLLKCPKDPFVRSEIIIKCNKEPDSNTEHFRNPFIFLKKCDSLEPTGRQRNQHKVTRGLTSAL